MFMVQKVVKIMRRNNCLKWSVVVIGILIFTGCLQVTGFSLEKVFWRGNRFYEFLAGMFPPDTKFCKTALTPLVETIRMSVAGTFAGSVAGIFSAMLCSEKLIKNKWIATVIKFVIQCIRTIPVLILALLCTYIAGIGSFAGTVSLAIYTFAVMTRIGNELIETTSLQAFHALFYAGAGTGRAFVRSVLVQIMPEYCSNALYLLETNVRHAAILGYVGAGGIGILLNEKISWREYQKVGTIMLLLYLVVLVIESGSEFLRKYLNGSILHTRRKSWSVGIGITLVCLYSMTAMIPPRTTQAGVKIAGAILHGLIHPDLTYLFSSAFEGVFYLLFQTVCIAFAGTIMGALAAFFLSFLNSFRLMPLAIAVPFRLMIMAIRTIPVFIYGLMFIRVTGPGSAAGVLTLGICSIGLISKRFTTAIDRMDLSAWQAYQSMGIGWLARVKYCIMPQIMPYFLSTVLYRFDVNLRAASILGLVGAGGIGAPLITYMNNYRWDAVGSILLGLVVLILLVEAVSSYIRATLSQ